MNWIRLITLLFGFGGFRGTAGINEAASLFSHLFIYGDYNKLIRPVQNLSESLIVRFGLKLVRVDEVNLKEQSLKTVMWVEQTWTDAKLKWDPDHYGGLKTLEVPSELIWVPDIVLANSMDGDFAIPKLTKATLHYNSQVQWLSPVTFISSCEIDVEFFPFDKQTCVFKFQSWTYDGNMLDLRHKDATSQNSARIENGIDLHIYYPSVEWNILSTSARRNEIYYTCCPEVYLNIEFSIELSRKTLVSTMLMIPLTLISFLTIFVFKLPSNSGEKMPLCAAILILLSVVFCILADSIPPTSIVIPLIGKYIIFAFVLLITSMAVTILTINIHYRSPATHQMSPWVKTVFTRALPKILCLKRVKKIKTAEKVAMAVRVTSTDTRDGYPKSVTILPETETTLPLLTEVHDFRIQQLKAPIPPARRSIGVDDSEVKALKRNLLDLAQRFSEIMEKFAVNMQSIAKILKDREDVQEAKNDWKFMAHVLDTLFFWIFTFAWIAGTTYLILIIQSTTDGDIPLYDGMRVTRRRGSS